MKTQINTIVNGGKIGIGEVSPNGGTNVQIRQELFEKILSENPDSMLIEIDGFKFVLTHGTSSTGKTHFYKGIAPLELWKKWEGNNCLSVKREDECLVILAADCTLTAQILTSKAGYYSKIQNNLVTIH